MFGIIGAIKHDFILEFQGNGSLKFPFFRHSTHYSTVCQLMRLCHITDHSVYVLTVFHVYQVQKGIHVERREMYKMRADPYHLYLE